jgi:hypothetical protein
MDDLIEFRRNRSGKGSDEFWRWIQDNPEGYFVNLTAPGQGMIHLGGCCHMKFPDPGAVNFVLDEKWCAKDRERLTEYAANRQITLRECSGCFDLSRSTPIANRAVAKKQSRPVLEFLGPIIASRRTGIEPFHRSGTPLGVNLLDFWGWDVSDLLSNATRGILAEYIVARGLGISTAGVRNEWAAYDLTSPDGVKIEVKSSAYLQAWYQSRLSTITFSTRLSRAWDPETNVMSAEARRQADVYVFALLAHRDKRTVDPLDIDQWIFYVVPTWKLNARTRSQHSITLKSLEAMCAATSFDDLPNVVRDAAKCPPNQL